MGGAKCTTTPGLGPTNVPVKPMQAQAYWRPGSDDP
jgi:hypothetical protein